MRKSIIVAFLALGMLVSAVSRAHAWGLTWMGMALEEAVKAARFKSGPLKYDAALLFNGGHSSDIYSGSTIEPVPDFTLTAGPSLHFLLPLRKGLVVEAYDLPQYLFFVDTKRERTLNNVFAGAMHLALDRLYFQAGGGLIDAKERLSTELALNVRRRENRVDGMALWQASKDVSFAVQFRRTVFRYEQNSIGGGLASVSTQLDRTEDFVDASAFVQQGTRVRYYIDAQYGSYDFDQAVSNFKNSRTYGVSGGLDFLAPAGGYEGPTSGVRGSLNLGYKRLNFLDPAQKDFSGISGDASVSVGIIKLTAIHATFSRGPQFSVYSGVAYYVGTAYGLGLSRALSKRVLVTYDFHRTQNDYPEGFSAGGGPPQSRVDRYATHAFRLDFGLTRNLVVGLMADLNSRDSKAAFRPVSRYDYFGISMVYGRSSGVLSPAAGTRS